MRGVVSLTTALALPARFPGRDIIIFLAFCAIFATLVLQGTTLGWVIRRLGLKQEETTLPEPDTAKARAELAAASLDAVQEHLDSDASEHGEAAAELVEEYKVRAERAKFRSMSKTITWLTKYVQLSLGSMPAGSSKADQAVDHGRTTPMVVVNISQSRDVRWP